MAIVYRIYHKQRISCTVNLLPGTGRKNKFKDYVYEQIRELLKSDNTLSSTEFW